MRVVLLACLATAWIAHARPADRVLVVATYGGEWGEAISRAILKPFERKTGVRLVVDPAVSRITLAKLKLQRWDPQIDVAWMDGGISELASADGLLETLSPERIPNMSRMLLEAIHQTDRGEVFSLSTGYYALGLVYNRQKVDPPPTSYLDLLRPEYAGKMTMPSPANAMGLPLLVALAEIAGGSAADIGPAIRLLRRTRPVAYFDTSGIGTNLFQSQEAVIGAHFVSPAWLMADKGLPIAYAVPKEGALAGDIRIHIAKNTKQRAEAERLVDYAVGAEAQRALAEILFVAPTAANVALSARARARMPYGPAGSIRDLRLPNWQVINGRRAELTQLWNRQIATR